MNGILYCGPIAMASNPLAKDRKPHRKLIAYANGKLTYNHYGTELSPMEIVTRFFPNGVEPKGIQGFSDRELSRFRTVRNLDYHYRMVALKTVCDAIREGDDKCGTIEFGTIGEQEFLIVFLVREEHPTIALEIIQNGEAAICS
jgi:hypothetical protein